MSSGGGGGGASISPCGQFRYGLWRWWDLTKPRMRIVMLNPSTADALLDDHTIRKVRGFAMRLGFGAFEVTNLFAFRSTAPAIVKKGGDWLVGPDNNACLRQQAQLARGVGSGLVIAWGAHARGMRRVDEVMAIFSEERVALYALAFTHDRIPRHPLMLSYDCPLQLAT